MHVTLHLTPEYQLYGRDKAMLDRFVKIIFILPWPEDQYAQVNTVTALKLSGPSDPGFRSNRRLGEFLLPLE